MASLLGWRTSDPNFCHQHNREKAARPQKPRAELRTEGFASMSREAKTPVSSEPSAQKGAKHAFLPTVLVSPCCQPEERPQKFLQPNSRKGTGSPALDLSQEPCHHQRPLGTQVGRTHWGLTRNAVGVQHHIPRITGKVHVLSCLNYILYKYIPLKKI